MPYQLRTVPDDNVLFVIRVMCHGTRFRGVTVHLAEYTRYRETFHELYAGLLE